MSIVTYIWLCGKNTIKSKIRVVYDKKIRVLSDIEEWNYDGSSTHQTLESSSGLNTEITLKPVKMILNPITINPNFDHNYISVAVLCDTYDEHDRPLTSNRRFFANEIFGANEQESWFGLEIEYFLRKVNDFPVNIKGADNYCGHNNIPHDERQIVEEHLTSCMIAGLKISGLNAEVVKSQWEYQIGPCSGIDSADSVILSRWILERVAERHGYDTIFMTNPYQDLNKSGCHINYSTIETRNADSLEIIEKYVNRLKLFHEEHIEVYGEGNDKRLTGKNETSSLKEFTWGIGTRNTSIRVPNKTKQYFEDRRPASTVDYYDATSIIHQTCLTMI